MHVKMNVHSVPCSLFPQVDKKSSDHMQHDQSESWEDMLSFGQHFDTAHEIEMELAQQKAGVVEKISDSDGHEEPEMMDEDSGGGR
jgi:hypothetical protein